MMVMTAKEKEVINNQISSVERYLNELLKYRSRARAAIEKNPEKLAALERYLYLAAQSAIDLGDTIISYKKLRQPTSLAETFTILAEVGILERGLADKLVNMAKFRNVLAHNYVALDYDKVFYALRRGPDEIKGFLNAVSKLV